MNKLGDRNYSLISAAVKTVGSYDPDEILYLFEEQLYVDDYDEVVEFLRWVHKKGKTFGHGNYEEVFTEFQESTFVLYSVL